MAGATTFETQAIVRLVDHLTGPLDAMVGKVKAAQTGAAAMAGRTAQHAQELGRSMTYGLTLPVVEGIHKMMDSALELSKIENTLQGVLVNRARTMSGLTGSAEQYAAVQKKILQQGEKDAIGRGGGMVNAIEYRKSALDGIKAGLDAQGAAAVAETSVNMALATRMTQHEAADSLLTLGNAFGVVTKNADGSAKSIAEMMPQYTKLSDLIATMSSNAKMSAPEAVASLKLSAPIAAAMNGGGNDMAGMLGVWSEAMAEKGIRGSEASVAQRAILMGLAAPKSTAIPTLADAGVEYYKYVHFKDGTAPTADRFTKYANDRGYTITQAQSKVAFAKARDAAEAAGGDPNKDFVSHMAEALVGLLKKSGKKANPISPDAAQKFFTNFASSGIESMDLAGLTLAMRNAGLTVGQLKKIIEGRQVTRAEAIFNKPDAGKFDVAAFAMERMFGKDWEKDVKAGHADPKYLGNAARMAAEHGAYVEGAMNRISASFANLKTALYDAGAFDGVVAGINAVSGAINSLSAMNPGSLKAIATGLTVLAAVGPVLWLGGSLFRIAGGLTALGVAALRFLEILPKVAVAATAARAAAGAAAGAAAAGESSAAVGAVAMAARRTLIGAAAIAIAAYVGAQPTGDTGTVATRDANGKAVAQSLPKNETYGDRFLRNAAEDIWKHTSEGRQERQEIDQETNRHRGWGASSPPRTDESQRFRTDESQRFRPMGSPTGPGGQDWASGNFSNPFAQGPVKVDIPPVTGTVTGNAEIVIHLDASGAIRQALKLGLHGDINGGGGTGRSGVVPSGSAETSARRNE